MTVAVLLGLLLAPLAAPAQEQPQESEAGKPPAERIERWSRTLDQAAQEIESGLITDARLEHWRGRLPAIRDPASELAEKASAQAESVRGLLDALGPPPEEGREPPAVAQQREKLNARLERYQARAKQAELVVARSEELLKRLSGARRTRFASKLMARGPSPLDAATWAEAGPAFVGAARRTVRGVGEWFTVEPTAGKWRGALPVVVAALAVSLLIAWPLRISLLRRFGRDPRIGEPSYLRRVVAAAVEGFVRGLLPTAVAAAVYLALYGAGLLSGLMAELAEALLLAIAFFSLVSGLTWAALAPESPTWRVIPFADESVRRLEHLLIGLAGLFAVDLVLVQLGRALQVPESLAVVHNLVVGVLIAGFVLALLRRRLWLPPAAPAGEEPHEAAAPAPPGLRPLLGVLLALVALAIPGTALAGYYVLSRFLAVRLVLTGVLAAVLLLLHALAREVAGAVLDPEAEPGRRVVRALALSEHGAGVARFWLLAGVDLSLVVAGLLVALPLWGVGWADVSTWAYTALTGFQIGNVTISLTDVLVAVALFLALWTATRFLQRLLEDRIFPQTRLDVGVRHSLKAAVGYAGLVLAGLLAISALGLDLSNLAIIAGALSVGIGFGLQAIVNNFVSGLILLIERPVKVGDWVVVGAYEGVVKRINVRATELETFDRAAVMVPNSELISAPVTNWTHKNRVCRVIVKVPAPYGCDTQQVHDILLRCAQGHPHVLRVPEPYVLFRGFGDSALDFELRAYARDADYYLSLGSDLHFAVDRALREAGIAVPFPQRDIHIKDAEPLRAGLAAGAGRPRSAGRAMPDAASGEAE